VQRSSGVFTLVQDGGESLMTVATQVPYQQAIFYRDYATGSGLLASGVSFQEVGTSLRVWASLLAGNQVRVRLTPRISYVATDGSGAIDFTVAATELVTRETRREKLHFYGVSSGALRAGAFATEWPDRVDRRGIDHRCQTF
jgi:pimeloyl-ACP methyl ester carboxylesterase